MVLSTAAFSLAMLYRAIFTLAKYVANMGESVESFSANESQVQLCFNQGIILLPLLVVYLQQYFKRSDDGEDSYNNTGED